MKQKIPHPGRPLGVAIAIIISVCLHTIFPLIQVAFTLRFRQPQVEADGLILGTTLNSVSDAEMFITVLLALAFLIIAIFAWRGRPAQIGKVFAGAVVVLAIIKLLTIVPGLFATPDIWTEGIDSGAELSRVSLAVQLVILVLTTLYVVWYMNRWAARAFYRGYYRAEEAAILFPTETAPPPNDIVNQNLPVTD